MAAESADNTWLVDMVIQLLNSAAWKNPINNFVMENCVKFDNCQDECKHEYFQIHQEFANLVDSLLTTQLLESDIDPQDFERQVVECGLVDDPRFRDEVSKMAAAEDFIVFKDYMMSKHQELRLSAKAGAMEAAEMERQRWMAAEALEFEKAMARVLEDNEFFVILEKQQICEKLGLNIVKRQKPSPVLEIVSILQDGLVWYWNASCADNGDKAVQEGDLVVSINGASSNAESMLRQLRNTSKYVLVIERPRSQRAAAAPVAPAAAPALPPPKMPTAAEERSFTAAGGAYGRGAMPVGGKKGTQNGKAAALRKAMLASMKPH